MITFGKKIPAAPATPAKPPMIQGGAAMMLKSMGIEPAAMEAVADGIMTDVTDMRARVERIEARQDEILDLLNKLVGDTAP